MVGSQTAQLGRRRYRAAENRFVNHRSFFPDSKKWYGDARNENNAL